MVYQYFYPYQNFCFAIFLKKKMEIFEKKMKILREEILNKTPECPPPQKQEEDDYFLLDSLRKHISNNSRGYALFVLIFSAIIIASILVLLIHYCYKKCKKFRFTFRLETNQNNP